MDLTITDINCYSNLLFVTRHKKNIILIIDTLSRTVCNTPNTVLCCPGARFSKVPKLFGHISGRIILFVCSKRRRLEARNFAVILIYIPFTTYEKNSFTELAGRSFTNGFSGLSRNRPQAPGPFRRIGQVVCPDKTVSQQMRVMSSYGVRLSERFHHFL